MKKTALVLVCLIFLSALSGCGIFMPLSQKELKDSHAREFNVYICGAVANEGYYKIVEGTDIFTAIEQAGVVEQSYLSSDGLSFVTEKTEVIAVGFYQNGKQSCINVNNPQILSFQSEIFPKEVLAKIYNYTQNVGRITDKKQLKDILGELYEEYFYKFFVTEDDYEEIS